MIFWLTLTLSTLLLLLTLPGTLEIIFLTSGAFLSYFTKSKKSLLHHKAEAASTIVIIPAHNEEKVIEKTLKTLKKCQGDFDSVVMADNCTDHTVEIVKKCGFRVISRNNSKKRGKSETLNEAYNLFLDKNYDIFIVVDADGLLSQNAIVDIQQAFSQGSDAVQIRYTVQNPTASWRSRLMHVAFMAYNHLRSKGRSGLGLSVGIHGNGFALSRKVIQNVPYTVNSLVEDIAYHLELVKNGYKVDYLEDCQVGSDMPTKSSDAEGQRARWEGGRFRLMIDKTPQLMKEISKGHYRLIEPLLDLLSLPLAYHCGLLILLIFMPIAFFKIYGIISLFIVLIYLISAIYLGGGTLADIMILFTAPVYLVWKMMIVLKIIKKTRSTASWDRTTRGS